MFPATKKSRLFNELMVKKMVVKIHLDQVEYHKSRIAPRGTDLRIRELEGHLCNPMRQK